MPTHLTPEEHLEGLRDAVVGFVRYAERAGLDAPVPTCPEWTVLDLVAHQGMVHRWAAALVRGERPGNDAVAAYEAEGRVSADPVGWLADGALEVATAVREAPEDRPALVFLNDAPAAPRAFWARRQCHETTIHAADALSASLGRPPRASETWIDPVLARDGIDELLGGFLTRPRSRLRCDDPAVLAVVPDDSSGVVGGRAGPGARGGDPARDGVRPRPRPRLGARRAVGRALPALVEPHREHRSRGRGLASPHGRAVDLTAGRPTRASPVGL